jgi:HSP20 family protein
MHRIRFHNVPPRRLHEDFGRVLEKYFRPDHAEDAAPVAAWQPRVDIREEEQRFVILADLPGIDPESIEVQMDKGVLSISGARDTGTAAKDAGWSRVERATGGFNRRFVLPDSADADGITASGKHGVLEIAIPKRATATPRRIQVQ